VGRKERREEKERERREKGPTKKKRKKKKKGELEDWRIFGNKVRLFFSFLTSNFSSSMDSF